MVIGIVSGKGGGGKSTVAVNLAGALARHGTVLVLDADPQGSVHQWAKRAQMADFEVLPEPAPCLEQKIGLVSGKYDFVLLDTAPSFGPSMRDAFRVSDKVICPVCPGVPDMWAVRSVLGIYAEEKAQRPALDLRVLITKAERRSTLARDFRGFLELLGPPVFTAEIGLRAVYSRAWLNATTVGQLEPNGPAAKEFEALAQEVRKWGR